MGAWPQRRFVVAILVTVSCGACAADDGSGDGPTDALDPTSATSVAVPAATDPVTPRPSTTTAGATTTVASTTSTAPAADCAPREGATVTLLPDVEVPAVEVAPIAIPAPSGADDVTIAGFTVPGTTVDAGCIIEHDVPGGCLGAVEITAAVIPSVHIPTTPIPPVSLAGGRSSGGEVVAAVSGPEVVAPAVATPAVCQLADDDGLPTVTRAGLVRPGVSRDGVARPGRTISARCDDGVCTPEIRIEAVRIEPVRLPDVDVAPARLRRQELLDGVGLLEGATSTSYVVTGDVLFDTDQATIRPDAEPALAEIGSRLASGDAAAPIRVEGHTDDRADDAYNLELSRRRAEAVAAWLVERAGIERTRLVVVGLGETTPAEPNDSEEHRAVNRRVVITL